MARSGKRRESAFSGGFFGADEDDADKEEDGSSNAFTFSLLGQLKDSLVTYDNSLKGFLDIAATPEETPGTPAAPPAAADTPPTPAPKVSSARDRLATLELERKMEEQKAKFQEELEEARASAATNLQKVLKEEEKKRNAELSEIEARAAKLAAEKQEMSGTVTELETVRDLKVKDEKKIERLLQGWAMEREQGELVKMAMVTQHKQEIEAVRSKGREKMVAMQAELVHTMEMLEKMYTGWQTSLEDALTEMRVSSEAERKVAVDNARKEMELLIEEGKRKYDYLNEQYQVEHTRRKNVHNKLVELMGNIRVICRVRPINKTEINSGLGQDCTSYPEEAADENIIIKSPVTDSKGKLTSIDPNDPGTKFEFDAVFGPDSTQLQVFNELKPLVTSCMDGFSVTIFAYGQTGSGKTYTMEGGDKPDGLCYRAFSELFAIRDQRCETGRMAYSIHVSMLEIYNEQVRDLLGEKNSNTPKSLDIRATPTGSDVPGLTSFEVHTPAEVHELMLKGNAARAVGGHSMNERSSRSHSCIRITITGENLDKGVMINAKLYLIDLAGSERVSKTDATGSRLKEAQNINKSLSALGNVMQALGKSKSTTHVPFRDSKLTYLLQDSLSGGSKVLMVVNVSPAAYNQPETLSSLNFAVRCRAIELGKATKNEETGEAAAVRKEIAALKKEVTSLKKTVEKKTTDLFEAEKKEMNLSQQLADAHNTTTKKSKDSEAMAQQHKARLEEMLSIKQQNETEINQLKALLEQSTASLEAKEEDVAAAHKQLSEVHEELNAAKEAKVAAEASAMGLGIELKNVTKELEQEREKNAKSETATISSFKSKLSTAEQKLKDAATAAAAAAEEQDALQEALRLRDVKITEVEDELGRVRAEYSALLTKMTMQRYQASPSSDDVTGGKKSDAPVNIPSNVVDQPLLTEAKLNALRAHAKPSRIPSRKGTASKNGKTAPPKLFVPKDFKGLAETLEERAKKQASVDDVRGPSRAPSRVRDDANTESTETWRNIEQQRKKMEELAKITFEEKEDVVEDDDDSELDTRRSSSLNIVDDSENSVSKNIKMTAASSPVVVAVEEAALAMSEETTNLTGDSPATDAEFAGFQAQFVGGITLSIIGSGSFGSKTKRKTKIFTIRFIPKKGLTLCWGKKDTIVMSTILDISCGAFVGGRSMSTTPLRTKGRQSWTISNQPVDQDSILVIRYNSGSGNASPRTSEDRSSGGRSSKTASTSLSDHTITLETKSPYQRDHIARCMRRLANQERERASVVEM